MLVSPSLIAQLIALGVEVIVTAGTPAAVAVAKPTTAIPCVMVAVGDPVVTGLVASLARPGGNMTGFTSIAPDLEAKRLALLREVVPHLSRIVALWNPANPFHVAEERQVQAAAQALHIEVRFLAVQTSEASTMRLRQSVGTSRRRSLCSPIASSCTIARG